MNWETNKPFPKNHTIDTDLEDLCEHVEQDHSLAHWMFCEDDSFGPVGRYIVCKECKTEMKEAADNEEELCYDCSGFFKNKDLKQWRYYYFNPREGDEPLLICNCCWDKPKHQKRIEQFKADKENEEANSPYDMEDYYEEDYEDYNQEEEEELDEDESIFFNPPVAKEIDHELADDGIIDRD